MFTRNSQMIIGLFIVVALAVVGSLLLSNNVGPAAIQSQSGGPTPPPPDFTAFAESYCCDSGTPKVMTPSTEQVALWTEVAQTYTQTAGSQAEVLPATPATLAVYLAPSDEWMIYEDPVYGFSLEYPKNWFVSNDGQGPPYVIAVTNFDVSLPEPVKGPTPGRFKMVIYPLDDMGSYKSLEEYLSDPKRALNPSQIVSETKLSVPNGYLVVRREEALSINMISFHITDGVKVYVAALPSDSLYRDVVDHVIATFTFKPQSP